MSGSGRRHTVPEVARLLGISERGVRDKIERGTLRAVKEGKRWIVLLPPEDAVVRGSGSGSGAVGDAVVEEADENRFSSATPALVEQAIARTGQQYTADLRAMLGELRAVYEGQIAAQRETIAELRRRAEAAEAERDTLRVQASPSPVGQDGAGGAPVRADPVDPPGGAGGAGDGLWARVGRWWRGEG